MGIRKNVYLTNQRVIDAWSESSNASRLVEDSILFYLDNYNKKVLTENDVVNIVRNIVGISDRVTSGTVEKVIQADDNLDDYLASIESIIELDI